MEYEEKQLKRFCSSGDIPGLLTYLAEFPDQKALLDRYEAVFIKQPATFEYPTDNAVLNDILDGYYQYYIYVFGQNQSPQKGEAFLLQVFQEKFNYHWVRKIDTMERLIKRMVIQEGYHYLGGTTSAYYGPYIWKTTEKHLYAVEIPSGTVDVSVFFMKEFISNSWLSFLAFGKTGTGGWTKRKGLFCKWDSYQEKLDQPSFQISFLKHEAQHLFDFQKYGRRLSQPLMEYRAKLCELSYYPNSDLFEQFLNTAKDDENYAHSQSEFWIVSDLSQALFEKEYVTDVEQWRNNYAKVAAISRQFLQDNKRLKLEKLKLFKR